MAAGGASLISTCWTSTPISSTCTRKGIRGSRSRSTRARGGEGRTPRHSSAPVRGALLDEAVIEAVYKFRYEPAVKDGARVKVRQTYGQTFLR